MRFWKLKVAPDPVKEGRRGGMRGVPAGRDRTGLPNSVEISTERGAPRIPQTLSFFCQLPPPEPRNAASGLPNATPDASKGLSKPLLEFSLIFDALCLPKYAEKASKIEVKSGWNL